MLICFDDVWLGKGTKLWFPSPNCSPQIRRAEPRDSIATAAWKAWTTCRCFWDLFGGSKACWHQKIIGFSDVHGFFGNLEIQNLTAFGTLDVVGLEDGLMVLICVNFILSSASWMNTNPIYRSEQWKPPVSIPLESCCLAPARQLCKSTRQVTLCHQKRRVVWDNLR